MFAEAQFFITARSVLTHPPVTERRVEVLVYTLWSVSFLLLEMSLSFCVEALIGI